MTRPIKRSFTIKGHRTSISLETPFWDALKDVAAAEDKTLSALITQIDEQQKSSGLSTAVRLYVLDHYRRRVPPAHAERD